MDEPVIEED